MPSQVINIPVDQGLVTSKDPSMLAEGELTRADDGYYEPNDPSLHKIKGRTKFSPTAETGGILGIRFLQFDGGATDLFVTRSATSYRQAKAGRTGTFSDLVTGLSSDSPTLEAVHYNDNQYLLDGVSRNYQIDSTGTPTLHSMEGETVAPTLTRDGGSGTGFILTTGKTILYWVEERVKSGDTILRRSAATSDQVSTLTGDGSTDKPLLTHNQNNSDATHWALFATASNGSFPTGAEINEVVIATTTIEDTREGTDPLLPAGTAYEVSSVSLPGGVVNNVARNGPAPRASTGCIYEDSLVLNDINNKRLVQYSWPDEVHKFPAHNFIRFETGEQDEVRMVRRMGNIIIVAMRDSLWRINILPRPEDSSFERERVKDQIDGAFGIVNNQAGVVFSFGQGLRFAYVSLYGIVITDGISWDVLTDDVKWEATVSIANLSNSVLRYNPNKYRLEFDYTALGGSSNTKALYLHVHPSHAKRAEGGGFRAKVTGPINRHGVSAMQANIGGERLMYTSDQTFLYLEDNGQKDNSSAGAPKFSCHTGERYKAGTASEAKIDKIWAHHSAGAAEQTATMLLTQRSESIDDDTITESFSVARREATLGIIEGQGESFIFGVENSDSLGTFSVDYLVVQSTNLGETKAG